MNRFVLHVCAGLAVTCLLIFASSASAENGALDAEFGAGGKVVLESPNRAFARGVAEHQGGLIVGVGYFAATGPLDIAAIRLTGNGSIDTSFASGGMLRIADVGKVDDFTVAPDGRVAFVAGFDQLTVVQSNGTLDGGFGSGGRLNLKEAMGGLRARAAEFQPDGKLVVVGYAATTATLAAVRLNHDGSADASFGSNGLVLSPSHPMPTGTAPPGLAISSSGQILVGLGEVSRTLGRTRIDTGVLRLAANGSVENAFGTAGVARIFEFWHEQMQGVTEVSTTSSGALGVIQSSSLARCTRGCLNMNYAKFLSSRGDVSLNTEIHEAYSVAATHNNQFVVTQGTAKDQEMLIARHSAVGKLVRDFDSNGFATASVGRYSSATHVTVQSDTKIVMAGSSCTDRKGACRIAVVRLLGERGGRAAPQPRIDSTVNTIYRSTRLSLVTGVASPSRGLRRVGIAIQLVKPASGSAKGCNWLTRTSGDFRRRAEQNGKCLRPIFMRASGTKSWKFKLKKRLAPGRYRIFVRATARNRLFNPLTTDHDSFREFRVLRR